MLIRGNGVTVTLRTHKVIAWARSRGLSTFRINVMQRVKLHPKMQRVKLHPISTYE